MIIGMLGVLHEMLYFGHGFWSRGWWYWAGVGTFLLVEALGIGLLYVFAVALLSPRPANRMMVPRLYLTGCWAAAEMIVIGWLILSALAAAPWAIGQWRRFTPYQAATADDLPRVAPQLELP